jgi:hypothetical protein
MNQGNGQPGKRSAGDSDDVSFPAADEEAAAKRARLCSDAATPSDEQRLAGADTLHQLHMGSSQAPPAGLKVLQLPQGLQHGLQLQQQQKQEPAQPLQQQRAQPPPQQREQQPQQPPSPSSGTDDAGGSRLLLSPTFEAVRSGPGTCNVECGRVRGVFHLASERVVCQCRECEDAASQGYCNEFIPSEFERHGGMAACKKWRFSIKVGGSALQHQGGWVGARAAGRRAGGGCFTVGGQAWFWRHPVPRRHAHTLCPAAMLACRWST